MCFRKKNKPVNSLHPKKERIKVTKYEIKMILYFLVFIVIFVLAIKLAIDCTSWYNIHNLA